jgi:hypothetical protein
MRRSKKIAPLASAQSVTLESYRRPIQNDEEIPPPPRGGVFDRGPEVSRLGTMEGLPSWGRLLTARFLSALYPPRSPRQLCFPKSVAQSVQFD